MRAVVLVLTCYSCMGHGREAQTVSEDMQGSLHLDAAIKQPRSRNRSGVQTFATLLLRFNAATAWQVTGVEHASAQLMRNPKRNNCAHSPVMMRSVDEPAVDFRVDRRTALAAAASLSSMLVPKTAVLPALAAENDLEYTIPMKTLTAALATAAPRDVVITGCNSGVGLAGAKLLTAAGHRVICACRTQAKADAAVKEIMSYAASTKKGARAGGSARGAVCDLSSLSSVRAFAKSLEGSRIDTLVLNAGLSRGTSEVTPTRTAEGFEETIGVNHLGHFLLANMLTPTLAASPKPRLVITASPVHDPTSGGGNVGSKATLGDLSGLASGPGFEMVDGGKYDPDKAYKDSKLCNMMFMAEAARRLESKGITVNAFSPGLIADPKGFFRNQNQLFATVFNTITKVVGVAESNEFGGSGLAYLSVDPAVETVTGKWFDSLPAGKHQLAVHPPSEEARLVESQTKLWKVSSVLVGVQA